MKQLLIYFGLAYLISWSLWFPLYGHAFGFVNLPTLPFHHGIGGLGPLIASFLSTWIFEGKKGISLLVKKSLQLKPMLYLAIALLSPFILAFVAAAGNFLLNKSPMNLSGLLSSKEFPQFNFVGFFIYNLIFFGYGEELGWRGFALPRFQEKMNALWSSIILTVFWAIWHWPLFFYRTGYTSMDIAGVSGWIFSLLTGSILLTWLYNSSKANLLICAIFHSTIDIAFTADFADKTIITIMGFLITVWGILTILVFKPKNLAATERVKHTSP